jgi:large subunit ribosomal protein L4
MAQVSVYNVKREKVADIELPEALLGQLVKPHLLHEVVKAQLNNRRAGTASTKGRAEVRGGGKKPWRQKGTGRARAGSNRSPLWRGGGVVFGPKPRDYSQRPPKKVRRQALLMALSAKAQDEQLTIVDSLGLERIKTKDFLAILGSLGLAGKKCLVVYEGADPMLEKSSRNVPGVKAIRREGLNVYDILKYENLVLLQPAVEKLAALLGA